MKPHSSRTCGQTSIIGSPAKDSEASEHLYWTSAPDALFSVRATSEGQFLYEAINPAFSTILAIPSDKIRGMPVSDCMGREDADALHEAFRACLAEGAEVRVHHRLALGGSLRDIETIVAPVRDLETALLTGVIGCHRTLSERSGTADRAHARMSAKLASIQQDIAQRIASDLHDSTCQHLVAASLGVMRIRSALGDRATAERLCDDIDASIDHALSEIRTFTYLLHPQDLMADGLKATIEQYACGFAGRTSLKVSTEIAPEVDRLPDRKRRSLLRVIQEALTNVFRHAKATEVTVAIRATESHFWLWVRDNGRGMADRHNGFGAGETLPGVGITAMRARLQQLGGKLEIRSTPARRSGTTLYAVFPHHLASKPRRQRKTVVNIRGRREPVAK